MRRTNDTHMCVSECVCVCVVPKFTTNLTSRHFIRIRLYEYTSNWYGCVYGCEYAFVTSLFLSLWTAERWIWTVMGQTKPKLRTTTNGKPRNFLLRKWEWEEEHQRMNESEKRLKRCLIFLVVVVVENLFAYANSPNTWPKESRFPFFLLCDHRLRTSLSVCIWFVSDQVKWLLEPCWKMLNCCKCMRKSGNSFFSKRAVLVAIWYQQNQLYVDNQFSRTNKKRSSTHQSEMEKNTRIKCVWMVNLNLHITNAIERQRFDCNQVKL